MAMNLGSRGSFNADINVTPLVDVMLVLLIIMMLIAPILRQGVPVTLPQAGNGGEKPDNAGTDGRRGRLGRQVLREPAAGRVRGPRSRASGRR